ncbi:MAG: hypothetical protein ACKO2G_05990 [Verrucomicrobiales bacterium]
MNMKMPLILSLIFLWASAAQAELRVIGVLVTRDANSKVHVSIASDVAKEKKKDIGVDEAAGILRDAQGWGSSVAVGIVVHEVPLQDYLPLLKAISESKWLELAFIEGQKPDFINDNIKKSIEQQNARTNTP